MFYERLFDLDPGLRALFPMDLRDQGRKLTAMISVAVKGLTQLESVMPAVQELGRRHVTYGVTDAHYDTVAQALLWTLDQGLGDDFTAEVSAAWVEVYTLLAATMKQAAASQVA